MRLHDGVRRSVESGPADDTRAAMRDRASRRLVVLRTFAPMADHLDAAAALADMTAPARPVDLPTLGKVHDGLLTLDGDEGATRVRQSDDSSPRLTVRRR